MVASDLVRASVQLAGAALLLSGAAQIWQLAVLAALHGAAEAFFRPAAGALLPQIVPAARLQQANALMGMSDNFGWMVGPAVAGVLVAVIGAGGAIAIDGVTFLVSAAFLATLRVPAVLGTEPAHGFFAELHKGWYEVKSRTWLWVMLLRVCLVLCIVIAPFQVLGPLGLIEEGYGAAAWGWLQAVFSAGMIVGMLVAMRYRPRRPMITVTLTGSTAVAAPLALAIFGDPWVLGVVYGLRGVSVGILVAVWNTTLQTQIAKESLGRVTAGDWMASLALWPVGLAVAGPLAQAFGVTPCAGRPVSSACSPPTGCCSSGTCGGCDRRRRSQASRPVPGRLVLPWEVSRPLTEGRPRRGGRPWLTSRRACPAAPPAARVQQDVEHDASGEDRHARPLQPAELVLGDGVGDGGARHEDPADEAPEERQADAAQVVGEQPHPQQDDAGRCSQHADDQATTHPLSLLRWSAAQASRTSHPGVPQR
jgi:MFS family permease